MQVLSHILRTFLSDTLISQLIVHHLTCAGLSHTFSRKRYKMQPVGSADEPIHSECLDQAG